MYVFSAYVTNTRYVVCRRNIVRDGKVEFGWWWCIFSWSFGVALTLRTIARYRKECGMKEWEKGTKLHMYIVFMIVRRDEIIEVDTAVRVIYWASRTNSPWCNNDTWLATWTFMHHFFRAFHSNSIKNTIEHVQILSTKQLFIVTRFLKLHFLENINYIKVSTGCNDQR